MGQHIPVKHHQSRHSSRCTHSPIHSLDFLCHTVSGSVSILGRGSRFQLSWDFSSATAGLLYVHRGPELVSAFHAIERTITIRLNFIRFSSSTKPSLSSLLPARFQTWGLARFLDDEWRTAFLDGMGYRHDLHGGFLLSSSNLVLYCMGLGWRRDITDGFG